MEKTFTGDLDIFKNLILEGKNFAFARFSDGEADILKNIKLSLESHRVVEGSIVHNFGYPEDDHKLFDPEEHQFVREALLDSFQFCKKGYYKGVGDPCCNGEEYVKWMRKLHGLRDIEHLTWANLFVNGNYAKFLEEMVPALIDKKVVIVCSKNAQLGNLPFNVVKDFRVGKNCIVQDHSLIEEMSSWIRDNDISDHVFLFSASSLSEILIHRLYKEFENNTYLDIGTTLHSFLELDIARDYLKAYWKKIHHRDLYKKCNWLEITYTVDNEEKYWDDILRLRTDPLAKKGFLSQEEITKTEHYEYMSKYGNDYIICLRDEKFVGYAGVVESDIRVAVKADFRGQGCGKYLIKKLIEKFPQSCAKIKKENIASIKIFKANGFSIMKEDKKLVYMSRGSIFSC